MLRMRLQFLFAFTIIAIFLTLRTPTQGQEKPDAGVLNKKKTIELLEKAQEEYRIFFKRPETGIEFWSAIRFEMDLGKFDLAALHLKMMLEKDAKDVDLDLVKIEQAEGMSTFLRMQRVSQWSEHPPFQKEAVANVEKLIERVTKAVETHLSDPVRLRKFINQLDAATPEERGFAYVQIARSRERAVPYLIEALRRKPRDPRLRETLLRMGPETVPVYLEVFKAVNDKDAKDLEPRLTLLDIVQKRDDKRVLPYLWHLSAAKQYPEAIRKRAKEVLASLLRMDVSDLPPAKESLALLAERAYQHKLYPKGESAKIWEWNGEAISNTPVELTPYRLEEVFGLRYAREALDLEPSYQPAQVVVLSLMLERAYRPKVDQILLEPVPPPKMQQLLATIDADLLMRVLERAMEDHQIPVILPLIQALGERGEARAARADVGTQPRGVARGLYYPDRRVQFASMVAMLRMPSSSRSAASGERIVELSRRFLASDAKGKAMVVYAPVADEAAARKTITDLGYDAVIARRGTDAIEKGQAAADLDLVILHHGMPDAEFPFVFGQLRRDFDIGGLPMIVVVKNGPALTIAKLEQELLVENVNADRAQEVWEEDKKATSTAPASIRKLVAVSQKKRTEEQNREVKMYFRSRLQEFKEVVEKMAEASKQPDRGKAVRRFVAKDPGVVVISEDQFKANDDLKNLVENQIKSVQYAKLSADERQRFAKVSMDTLKKMALGEIQGYDVRPAVDAIKTQVRSPAFSLDAIETLGRLQGEPIQAYLASLVGNPANDAKAMRTPAVLELNRHLQRNGVQINKKQVDDLKRAATLADEGSALRNQLNVTVGIIARASAPRTGAELLQFRPDPPAKEKEKEEKKEKEKEKDKDN